MPNTELSTFQILHLVSPSIHSVALLIYVSYNKPPLFTPLPFFWVSELGGCHILSTLHEHPSWNVIMTLMNLPAIHGPLECHLNVIVWLTNRLPNLLFLGRFIDKYNANYPSTKPSASLLLWSHFPPSSLESTSPYNWLWVLVACCALTNLLTRPAAERTSSNSPSISQT